MSAYHTPARKRRALATIDIFSDLGEEELARMNDRITPFASEPGRLLYAPGEPAESLFLLARGRVHLYRLAPNGKKLVVAALRDGAFFGAVPAGLPGTYHTYAEAARECTLYALDRVGAERLLRDRPEVALRVVGALAGRLERLEQRLVAMAFQTVRARLAELLLRLAGEQGGGLVRGYTHQDLADMLGAYRETISETLDTLRTDGLVYTGRKEIGITDRERLENLTSS